MATPKPSVPITILVCLGYFTRYHRLGSLNNRNLFLRVLAAGSQRADCWHGQVLVKAFFLTCRLPHFCCVLTWWRKRGSLPAISYKGNNPITVAPPSWTCFAVAVQSLSLLQLFVTPWTTAHQAHLSFTIFWSLLRFMSIDLVMLSNHLILWCPLLLLPALGSCSMSQLFASGGQSIGTLTSVLPMNTHSWFPLGLTCSIFKGFPGGSGIKHPPVIQET